MTPHIEATQKGLTKILDLTNSSKIFFVNNAILVEGETDEYFFNFLLEYLQANATEWWQSSIAGYEVFNIKRKGARGPWTDFLQKFGLKTFLIGDWDNISEVTSFNLESHKSIYDESLTQAGASIQSKGSADGAALFATIDRVIRDPSADNITQLRELKDYIAARVTNYPRLIEHIRNSDVAEWVRINSAIDAAYAERVFILKKGELEDYLGIEKGIQYVIKFCQTAFTSWLGDSTFGPQKDEIYAIIRSIFPEPQGTNAA